MSSGNPLTPLLGLIAAIAAGAIVSLIVAGHVVAVALAGAAVAYGLLVWQSGRLRRFERGVEERDSEERPR